MMDSGRFVLYDRHAVLGLWDDPDFRADIAEGGWLDGGEVTDEVAFEEAAELAERDLGEEVTSISDRLGDRVRAEHPDWRGSYLLMARGTIGRWDGESSGHNYYAGEPATRVSRGVTPFEQLVGDTGWNGIFKDCEIDLIWEDPGGTVHVEGAHHDGRVEVAVRAVGPDTEQDELDSRDWDGSPGPSTARIVEGAWEGGVRADMASLYGHEWSQADLVEQLSAASSGPDVPGEALGLGGEAR